MILSESVVNEFIKKKSDNSILLEHEGKQFLSMMGIQVPKGVLVSSLDDAKQTLKELGFPVVMKGIVPGITHKSDHNLVRIGITDQEEFECSYKLLTEGCHKISNDAKILIEKHVSGSLEFVIGLTTDANFGKVLMFGLGGIFVEVIQDVTFKLCPIDRKDAREMIDNLKARSIFYGVRGKEPVDLRPIEDLLLLIGGKGGIADKYDSSIDTIEINPAKIDENGIIIALDAVVKLASGITEGKVLALVDSIDMTKLFNPETIGIVGISPDKSGFAKTFLKASIDFGYNGRVYPINTRHGGKELMGWKIFDRISAVPEDIDYLYVSIPASAIPSMLAEGRGKIRFAHIMTGGFGEAGIEGKLAEEGLLNVARENNIRLIGPNCLGMYSPEAGITLIDGVSKEVGSIGLISQSGGLTVDIVRKGGELGLRFSKAISIGNSIDLGTEEFLEFLGRDDKTKIICMYLEQVKDGRRFFKLLREICKIKPVLIIKGGRGRQGAKATSSHTGALASDIRIWDAMSQQSGAILVESINELLDTLLAFQNLDLSMDNTLIMIGPSGGATVLAADQCDESGLELTELGPELENNVMSLGIPPGTSIRNPIDTPVGTLALGKGKIVNDILEIISKERSFAFDILHLNVQNILAYSENGLEIINNIVETAIERGGDNGLRKRRLALVIRGNREKEVEDIIRSEAKRALKAGVPVFFELKDAIKAIGKLVNYSIRLNS